MDIKEIIENLDHKVNISTNHKIQTVTMGISEAKKILFALKIVDKKGLIDKALRHE
jgi:hypothetical protein